MIKPALKICLILITLMLGCTPTTLAERFFADYMDRPIQEVFAAVGQPDSYTDWVDVDVATELPAGRENPYKGYMAVEYARLSYGGRLFNVVFAVKDNVVTGLYCHDTDNTSRSISVKPDDWRYLGYMGHNRAQILNLKGPPRDYTWRILLPIESEDYGEKLVYDIEIQGVPHEIIYTLVDDKVVGLEYFGHAEMPAADGRYYALAREDEIAAAFSDPVWLRREKYHTLTEPERAHWRLVRYFLNETYAAVLLFNTVENDPPVLNTLMYFWNRADNSSAPSHIAADIPDKIAENWNDAQCTHGGNPVRYGIIPKTTAQEQP